MSNFFDQFDTVATAAPEANPFDQFDSVSAPRQAGNFFDQYDAPSAAPSGNVFGQFDYQKHPESALSELTPQRADKLGTWQYRGHLAGASLQRALPMDNFPRPPVEERGTQSDWGDAGKSTVHGLADSALTIGQGILTEGSRFFADERNPYFERAGEANIHHVAQQDVRKIEQELTGLKKQWDDLVAEGVATPTALIPQIADAQKRLGFAREAAAGQISETPYAAVSRGLEDASGVIQAQRDLASSYYNVDPDFAQSFIGQLTKAAGGMVPQAVTGRLPLVGLAALQSQGFQNAWDDAKHSASRQGREFDPEQAFRYALTDSFQQALLERIGLDSIGGSGAAKTLFQRIRKAVLGEGVTETIQGFGQDVGANVFGIETRNPFDIQKRGTEFAIGSILGTGGATLHHSAQKFDERVKAPAQSTPEAPAPKYNPERKGKFKTFDVLPPQAPTSRDENAAPISSPPEMEITAEDSEFDHEHDSKYASNSDERSQKETGPIEPIEFGTVARDIAASARAIQEAQPGTPARSAEADALRGTTALPRIDLEALGTPHTEASEHAIWFSPETGSVVKATAYGRFGHDFERGRDGGTVTDYLERMELASQVFGDPVRLLGKFTDRDGNAGLVIAQDFIPADPNQPNPSIGEISDYLASHGFHPVPDKPGRFLNDSRGVEVDDTHPGNFIKSLDGNIHPIDLMVRRIPSRGLQSKIKNHLSEGGFVDLSILEDISNYGRAVFQRGKDFLDWSVRMLRDLGDKIAPYLRSIWHTMNHGGVGGGVTPGGRRTIRVGIDARSLKKPAPYNPERASKRRTATPRSPSLPQNPQPATITRASAALAILQQERNSLLQKLDTADSRSAEGSILRERLGEINAQIDKFNNLPGSTPAPTNRKNGAALSILQQEKYSLLQRIDKTDSRSAEGSILRERLGEINAQIDNFETLEHHHGEGRLPHPQTAHATEETGLPKNPGYDTQDSHEQGSQERKAVRNGMPARKTPRSEGDSSGNESTKQEARAATPAFHALGVHIVSGRKITRVVPQPNGGIVLEVNETELHAQDRKADRHGLTPGSYTRGVLGEELSHAGHAAVLKEDWLNDNEGLLFDDYVAKKNHELFQDIRRTIEHASPRERVALLQAVQDVYNLYYADMGQGGSKTVADLDTALARIESDGKGIPFAVEFIRQAVQLRRQGAITENILANILARLGAWVRPALERVRAVLPGVYDGAFGERARDMVHRINELLDTIDGKPPRELEKIEPVEGLPGMETRRGFDNTSDELPSDRAEQHPSRKIEKKGGDPALSPESKDHGTALSLVNEERARLLEQLGNTKPNTATASILTERLHELNTLATRLDTQRNQEPQLSHPPDQRQETSKEDPAPLLASGASRPSTRIRPDTNTSTANRPPSGTPAHPSRTNGAALAILHQERNSLLQKLDTTDSQSAKGSILRERLGEINAQIDKFNNLPGSTLTQAGRKNGAALAILQQETNALLQKLDATNSRSTEGSILNERLGEINALIDKFAAQENQKQGEQLTNHHPSDTAPISPPSRQPSGRTAPARPQSPNGAFPLDWAGKVMAGLPTSHAVHLGKIWSKVSGHKDATPAQSFSEAATRLNELLQERLEYTAFLKGLSNEPDFQAGWEMPALRSRIESIASDCLRIISVPESDRVNVSIDTTNLPAYLLQRVDLGAKAVRALVSSKLGSFNLRAKLTMGRNSFVGLEGVKSLIRLRPDVDYLTVAHEIAHDIEHRHPKIKEAARAFLMERAAEGDTVPLSSITGRKDDTDPVHLDKWEERGGRAYTGRDYPDGETEILTEGIERLYSDPGLFYEQDPDYFEFVVRAFRMW